MVYTLYEYFSGKQARNLTTRPSAQLNEFVKLIQFIQRFNQVTCPGCLKRCVCELIMNLYLIAIAFLL